MDQKKTTHFPGWNRHSLHEDELNGYICLVWTDILYMRMNWMVTFPWLMQPFFTWGWTEWSHSLVGTEILYMRMNWNGHISLVGTGILYKRINWMVTFPWLEQAYFTWGWTEWSHFPGLNRYSLHENELNESSSLAGAGILYIRINWMVTFPWLKQAFFTWEWTEWSHFPGWAGILYMRMNWMVTFPWLEQAFFTWGRTEWSHFLGWNSHYLYEDEMNDHVSLFRTGILYMRMNWKITFPWLE